MRRAAVLAAATFAATLAGAPAAFAQASDMYLGQMMLVPYNFCPRGWTEASGQIMNISSNSALFSLLGTTYGGNGQTTFALPDLRGRVPVHVGQGSGLPNVDLGQVWGTPTTTLNISNLPQHNHSLNASAGAPNTGDPTGASLATFTGGASVYDNAGAPTKPLKFNSIGMTGSNIPFDQYQPSLGMRWCIALSGIFPARN
jgi:microcystin-dependent protein